MFSASQTGDGVPPAAGLAELLSPIQSPQFFKEFWEKKALYLPRNDAQFYQSLFSLEDFDSLLSHAAPRYPEIRVIDQHAPHASAELIGAGWSEGGRDARISSLYGLYERGSTIQIHNMQDRWQPIGSLCRQLETTLHSPVDANAYLYPRNAPGFRAHYDSYDAFIVQIYGSKPWQVFEPSHALPLEDPENHSGIAGIMPEVEASSPFYDVLLQAGDLLYLPRGWCHRAGTSTSPSLYLSIMMHVYRWKDLIAQALLELSDTDVRFRKALPVRFADPANWSADDDGYFDELLNIFSEKALLEPARKRLSHTFFKGLQPVADGHFAHISKLADLTAQSLVEKRFGVPCQVVSLGDRVTIHFPGNQVDGPLRIEPSLRFIAGVMGPFRCGDLPGPLNEAGKLVLIRRLVVAGLLRLAGDARQAGA